MRPKETRRPFLAGQWDGDVAGVTKNLVGYARRVCLGDLLSLWESVPDVDWRYLLMASYNAVSEGVWMPSLGLLPGSPRAAS